MDNPNGPNDSTGAEPATRTRQGGGTGVATSDELLELGRGGVRFFERFLPRYEAWTGRTLGGGMAGIVATYDEVGGIRFDRLRADADRLVQVHGDLTDHNDQLAGNVGALREVWDGDAADAADDYGNQFLRDASDVADGVDVAHTLISMSADRAETAVATRASLVSGLDSQHVGGLTPHQVDKVIAAARGHADPVQMFEMVMLSAFAPLDDVPAFADEDSFTGMFDQASAWMGERGKQWLDGVFVPSVEANYQAFQQYCSITKQDVGDTWTGMNDGVGGLDPLLPGGLPGGQTAPADADAPQASGLVPVSATPLTAPTDGPVDVSAPTSPDAAQPDPEPAPPSPVQVTTPASTLPSAPQPSDDPVGASLRQTSAPAPAGDAQLAKAPGTDGGTDVGKIGDGLTLTKPDADGNASLTVRHPDGSTGQYAVNLGAMSGFTGSGTDGTTIHDGAMTITLHRPNPNGPVQVTVDPGNGGPAQSYTVDFDGSGTPSDAGDATLASSQQPPSGGATVLGGSAGSGTSADGSAGSSTGVGGGGAGGGQQAGGDASGAKPQPDSYRGVGQLPAAAVVGSAGGVAAGAGAATRGGMGMMPMMGGMGANGGRDHERKGGRWNATEDFFGEDTDSYAKISDMLEPELPSE